MIESTFKNALFYDTVFMPRESTHPTPRHHVAQVPWKKNETPGAQSSIGHKKIKKLFSCVDSFVSK
jgi:hypothetical protein